MRYLSILFILFLSFELKGQVVVFQSYSNSFTMNGNLYPRGSVICRFKSDSTMLEINNGYQFLNSKQLSPIYAFRLLANYRRSDSNTFANYVALRAYLDSFVTKR